MPDSSSAAEISEVTVSDAPIAESSTAGTTGVNSYEAAFDAALAGTEASPAAKEPGSKEPDPVPNPDAPPAPSPDELTDEEKKGLSERAQQRFRDLANSKKESVAEVNTLKERMAELEPKVQQYEQLQGYMQTNAISEAHLNNALTLTAMLNGGRFADALPILEGLVQQTRQLVGDILPPELQTQVDLGYITEAHAKELNKARKGQENLQSRVEKDQQRQAADRAQRESEAIVATSVKAADAWHAEQVLRDPDWNQKSSLVSQQMELALLKGGPDKFPKSEKEVRDLLDGILKTVDAQVGKFRPAPKPITPDATGGSSSARSAPKPASYEEALEAALRNG